MISNHSINFLQEQFKILYNSIDNISADKRLGDVLQFKIKDLTEKNEKYAVSFDEIQRTQAMTMAERD